MMFPRVFLLLLLMCAGASLAWAESPAVTAVLDNAEAEVEQPVQLQIKVTGGSSARPPNDIEVDGLDIRYAGESQLVEGRNFQFSYSFVYNYTILPLKTGTFTIPPLTVQTSSGPLRTPALKLNVVANTGTAPNSGATARRRPDTNQIDLRQIAFAEVVVPKTDVYIGEIVPVEIRLGLKNTVRHSFEPGVSLAGQGFTTQKLEEPRRNYQVVNGQSYETITYKTAIAAARSGKLEVELANAKAVVQVPVRPASRSRSPRDLFGMDDPFADPFFDQFIGRVEEREINFKANPAVLEVKPLPPNAPPSFAGAVGHFALTTDVTPKTAQVGDPLTVTASISGRGNFDRVSAPALEDERGWHTYPPSANFKPDDEIGMSGTKMFELVLTPNEPKKAVPPIVFSYFDPLKEQYVTLRSQTLPVVVQGGAAPASTPAVASASSAAPALAPRPTPEPQAQDILYQLTERGRPIATFAPVFAQPVFWAAQAVPMLALVGLFGWQSRRRRSLDREARKRAGWQHETAELQKRLRRTDDPPDEYFAEALRLVQLKTALTHEVEPNNVDAESAIAAFNLSDERRERMRELFRQTDELRYSGRRNGDHAVGEQTRRAVLELIESLG